MYKIITYKQTKNNLKNNNLQQESHFSLNSIIKFRTKKNVLNGWIVVDVWSEAFIHIGHDPSPVSHPFNIVLIHKIFKPNKQYYDNDLNNKKETDASYKCLMSRYEYDSNDDDPVFYHHRRTKKAREEGGASNCCKKFSIQ